ncbi:competence protein ComEA-like protein with helix-hairpin-helix repeat region [Halobacteroides halobius DSM 5150]|uniref:Competence protein ComEA-like protein with helix-hairpin-helix repeat region n=1 Tax=Halobacteroides halobius (strain ATCC 35273 / DSM 5150 / MD-1) TaxID=748449 RepID=L0KBT2_HALHC|nr:DUF4912 domain-containing protein [Halobacteroides halobius]AGB41548.1 competence protein ComEA-like protein with helix-hairpin-helix repeat region [Halobacteroides halobius DSM 5150]
MKSDTKSSQVNINTAQVEKLMSLKGIGSTLAQRIVDYRTSKDSFTSLGDLRKVKGIGKKLFASIQKEITTQMEETNLKQLAVEEGISSAQTSELAQKNKEDDKEVTEDIMNIYSLPTNYNDNKLVLQVKNPETAHLYWEYTTEEINKIVFAAGYNSINEVELALRIYDLDTTQQRNITIGLDNDNWYLNNLEPNHNYKVELGIIDKTNKFHSVIKSNQITMPNNTVSDEFSEKWMTVEERVEKIYMLSGGLLAGEGNSSVDVVRKLEEFSELANLASSLNERYSSMNLLGSSELLSGSSEQVK